MDIVFKEDTHQYFLDGVEVPSVTGIVSPLGPDLDDECLDNAIEAAADRGVTCHKILELLLNGETEIEYPSAYEPYVEAIRLFLSEHEIIPLAIETPIASEKHGFAGTPDLLCYYDGVLSIVDYKFVAQVAKTKVKAQLNGYLAAYVESGIFPERLYAIQFLNTGTYRPYPTAIDDTEFMLCLELHKLKNKKHPRGRIE